ncbi:MAG: hypothetical protein WAU68_15875 [Vitreimonas sp.]
MANPLNATFFAFRKREKGGVLGRASLAFLVVAIVLLGAFIAVNIQAIGPIFGWYGQMISAAGKGGGAASASMMTPPPAGFLILILSIIPFMFVFYVLFAAYEAACLRWMIRGETSGGFMGLSLGADTWRVYLTYWIWFGLYMGYSLVSGMVIGAIFFASFASGANPADISVNMGPLFLASLALRLVFYGVLIYFAVRLAPAAAITVARRQFAFFDAWTVTKGRFWALFGAFLIVFLIAFAIEIVIGLVVFGVAMTGAWSALMSAGPSPSPEQVSAFFAAIFTPQNFAVVCGAYIVFLALGLVLYVMFYGINARAVLAAAEDGKVQVPGIGVAEQFE